MFVFFLNSCTLSTKNLNKLCRYYLNHPNYMATSFCLSEWSLSWEVGLYLPCWVWLMGRLGRVEREGEGKGWGSVLNSLISSQQGSLAKSLSILGSPLWFPSSLLEGLLGSRREQGGAGGRVCVWFKCRMLGSCASVPATFPVTPWRSLRPPVP